MKKPKPKPQPCGRRWNTTAMSRFGSSTEASRAWEHAQAALSTGAGEKVLAVVEAAKAVNVWAEGLGYYAEDGAVLAPVFQDLRQALSAMDA